MNRVIEEYKVIVWSNSIKLSDNVNKSIADGWQPYGGAICLPENLRHLTAIAQPMVRYEGWEDFVTDEESPRPQPNMTGKSS